MRMRRLDMLLPVFAILVSTASAQKYDGPRPPKADLLYLVHADNLIPTETTDAKPDSKKDSVTYTIAGTASPARTPLAEPIFIIESDKIVPDRLELYRLDVKRGNREVSMTKGRRGGAKALHLTVTKLDGKLYRVEAGETLEDGEYSISPNDSDRVFCFEVY